MGLRHSYRPRQGATTWRYHLAVAFLLLGLPAPAQQSPTVVEVSSGQALADALATFGASGSDMTIDIAPPAGGSPIISMDNVTFMDPNTPGFSAGTVTLEGSSSASQQVVIDTVMRSALIPQFTGSAHMVLQNVSLINLCQLIIPMNRARTVNFTTGFMLGLFPRTRVYQSRTYVNITMWGKYADMATYVYIGVVQQITFPKVVALASPILEEGSILQAQFISITPRSFQLRHMSLPSVLITNTTFKDIDDPDDPLLQQMRAANRILPNLYCDNGTLVGPPHDLQDRDHLDPSTGPVWLTGDSRDAASGLVKAGQLSGEQIVYKRIPPVVMLLANTSLTHDVLPEPVEVGGALLLLGPVYHDPDNILMTQLDLAGRTGLMQLQPGAQLFMQQLVLSGLAQGPLPNMAGAAPALASTISNTTSALPLAAITSPADSQSSWPTDPPVWMHHCVLHLPVDDYLALLTLALQGTPQSISSCVETSTAQRAAALNAGISSFHASYVDPQLQHVVFGTLTGWGIAATELHLQPDHLALHSSQNTPQHDLAWLASCAAAAATSKSGSSGGGRSGGLSAGALAGVIVGGVAAALLAAVATAFLMSHHRRQRKQQQEKEMMMKNKSHPDGAQLSAMAGPLPAPGDDHMVTPRHSNEKLRHTNEKLRQVSAGGSDVDMVPAQRVDEPSGDGSCNTSSLPLVVMMLDIGKGGQPQCTNSSPQHAQQQQQQGHQHPEMLGSMLHQLVKGAEDAQVSRLHVQGTNPAIVVASARRSSDGSTVSAGAAATTVDVPAGGSTSNAPATPAAKAASGRRHPDTAAARDVFGLKQQQQQQQGLQGLQSGRLAHAQQQAAFSRLIESKAAACMPEDGNKVAVCGVLGRGSWGTVYEGEWRGLPVALKTMVFELPLEEPPRIQDDGQAHSGASSTHFGSQARAIMEAAIAASVGHKNLVCTYCYDIKRVSTSHTSASKGGLQIDEAFHPSVPGQQPVNASSSNQHPSTAAYKLFLVQELCGFSLAHALEAHALFDGDTGLVDQASVLYLLLDIARGLHYLHEHNIIHGDLKPANVLLKTDPTSPINVCAKLADFGLSSYLHEGATHISNFSAGTPFYVAPEVVQQRRVSTASDVYAFGILMWQMFTGGTPYMADAEGSFSFNPMFGKYSSQSQMPHPAFLGLQARCLKHEPNARPAAKDLIARLSGLLGLKVSTN